MSERYPAGAVDQALKALELAYSYLREKPVIEVEIRDAIQRLERAKELHEASNTDTNPKDDPKDPIGTRRAWG